MLYCPAREVGRTVRQRVYLDGDAGGGDFLLDLDIAGAPVEEGLEGVDITVALYDHALVGDARHFQLAGGLGEHDVLLPGDGAVGTAVEVLNLEALLLRQGHLTRIEALQIGHLAIELGEVDERIDLVGEQDWLLFAHALLRRADLDEQVAAGNGTAGVSDLAHGALRLLLAAALLSALGFPFHLDSYLVGGHGLAVNGDVGGRDGEGTLLLGHEDIGVGNARRAGHVAVDHLEARLGRRARTHEDVEGLVGDIAGAEAFRVVRIDGVAQAELLTCGDLTRGTARERLRAGNKQ